MHDFERDSFGPRTIIICDQCEREFHVSCLRKYTMGSYAAAAAAARDADAERAAAAAEEEAKKEKKNKGKGKAAAAAAAAALKAQKGKASAASASSPAGGCVLSQLPDGDWLCSRDCHRIYEALHRVVAAGAVPLAGSHSLRIMGGRDGSHGTATALRAASAVLSESFDPILDAATGADLTHAMTWSQSAGDWDFSNMLCALLYHRGVPMAAATFRVFGPRLAEFPLIATRSCGRRQGHCRVLLNALERVFAQLGVATMSLPAAAETVATWQSPAFGFAPMAPPQLRAVRQELRVLVFPGTTVLCKPVRALRGPPLLVPPAVGVFGAAGAGVGAGAGAGAAGGGGAAAAAAGASPSLAVASLPASARAAEAAALAAGFALAGPSNAASTPRLAPGILSGPKTASGGISKRRELPRLGPDGKPKKSRSGKRRKPGELSPTGLAALASLRSSSAGVAFPSPPSPAAAAAPSSYSKAEAAATKAKAEKEKAAAKAEREKAAAAKARAAAAAAAAAKKKKKVAKKLPSKLKPKKKLLKLKTKTKLKAPKPKQSSRKAASSPAKKKKKAAAVIKKKQKKPQLKAKKQKPVLKKKKVVPSSKKKAATSKAKAKGTRKSVAKKSSGEKGSGAVKKSK